MKSDESKEKVGSRVQEVDDKDYDSDDNNSDDHSDESTAGEADTESQIEKVKALIAVNSAKAPLL